MLYAKSRQVIISAAFRLRAKGGTLRRESPQHRKRKEDIRHGSFSCEIYDSNTSTRDELARVRNASWHQPKLPNVRRHHIVVIYQKLPAKIEFTILQWMRILARASNVFRKTLLQYSFCLRYSTQYRKYLHTKCPSSSPVVAFINHYIDRLF